MANDRSAEPLHEGGCLCRKVRYAVAGPPIHVMHCCCRFCQRATGSTHMFEPIWAKDALSFSSGRSARHDERSEGSGKQVHIHFCAECGTKLFLSFERFPDVVGLYGGTLDQPAAAVAGADHSWIFLSEASTGTLIPAGVKTWRQHRFTSAGDPIAPTVFDEIVVV